MNRREALGLMLMATSAGMIPVVAKAASGRTVIYDGRFDEARRFAAGAGCALDCREDVALLWYASGLSALQGPVIAYGLTTASDALVVSDCARRAGFRFQRGQSRGSALVSWTVTRPD